MTAMMISAIAAQVQEQPEHRRTCEARFGGSFCSCEVIECLPFPHEDTEDEPTGPTELISPTVAFVVVEDEEN